MLEVAPNTTALACENKDSRDDLPPDIDGVSPVAVVDLLAATVEKLTCVNPIAKGHTDDSTDLGGLEDTANTVTIRPDLHVESKGLHEDMHEFHGTTTTAACTTTTDGAAQPAAPTKSKQQDEAKATTEHTGNCLCDWWYSSQGGKSGALGT